MFTDLPNELISKIIEHLDILSLIRLSSTCRELGELTTKSIENMCKPSMVFVKNKQHKLYMYNTNEFVSYIKKDLNENNDSPLIANVKKYSMLSHFPDHTLTFVSGGHHNLLFHITPHIDFSDLFEFKMIEGYIESGKIQINLHASSMELPFFLMLIGVHVLSSCGIPPGAVEFNFDVDVFPEWYKRILCCTDYSGVLFSELFSSSVMLPG